MRVWGDREGCRRSLYSRTVAPRLCRQRFRLINGVAATIVVAVAMTVSGCSYRLVSLYSKEEVETSATGSIAPSKAEDVGDREDAEPAERDLAYARAAASTALARGGKDASVPWQNPQSGAGGNITPLDTAYSEDGLKCRDFLASYVHDGSHDWLQGAACRNGQGVWEVKRLKPLKPG